MGRTVVGSVLAVLAVVVASGSFLVAHQRGGAAAKGGVAGGCEGRCDATIECKEGGCVVRWTAPDGKTGEIELACVDGECKVIRCEGCGSCGSCDAKGAAVPAPLPQGPAEPPCCAPACGK